MAFPRGARPGALAIADAAQRIYETGPGGPYELTSIAALGVMAVARLAFELYQVAETLRASEPVGRP